MSHDLMIARVEELLAVHTLEQHNPSWLNTNGKDLALEKQVALRSLLGMLKAEADRGAMAVETPAPQLQVTLPYDPTAPVKPCMMRVTHEDAKMVFQCGDPEAVCVDAEISSNSGAILTLLQASSMLAMISRGSVVDLSKPTEGLCTKFVAGGFFHIDATMMKLVDGEEKQHRLVSTAHPTEIKVMLDKVVVTAEVNRFNIGTDIPPMHKRTVLLTLENADLIGFMESAKNWRG